jgi:anti-anti-sigma factor
MNIKIDTKEKFTVLTPSFNTLAANMTEEIETILFNYFEKEVPHIVLNLVNITTIDNAAATFLVNKQQQFYDAGFSFVICCLQKEVETMLDEIELLELMNVTPTESEAWDIIQMEEIERELLGD